MPPMGFKCADPDECVVSQVDVADVIEEELSEDVDTGLLGDLVNLFAAIAKFLR